jgi:GDPmannose 4,6-dehydratase
MWKMVQCEKPEDFVIATEVNLSLEEFAKQAFAELSLGWRDHTVVSDALFRSTDISDGRGNAAEAERLLGWKAQSHMKEVI